MSSTYDSALSGSRRKLGYGPYYQPALTVFDDSHFKSVVLSPEDARDLARRILEDYPEPRYRVTGHAGLAAVRDGDDGDLLVAAFYAEHPGGALAGAERLARELNGE